MVALSGLGKSILLLLLLIVLNSCALTRGVQVSGVYYAKMSVSYIREFPGYGSENVATVYLGDQMTILSHIKGAWCQVKTATGQTGWMQRPLLSPVPIPIGTYYVQASEVPLRPEPQQEIISRLILRRGAQVRKLAENGHGWWRVLVEKDESLGWLPAAMLAGSPPKETRFGVADKPGEAGADATVPSSRFLPKQYYVAATTLELHLLPLFSSPVVKVLQFNDKIEEVYQSGSQWLKVKYPETGVQGWTQASYLSESPGKTTKSAGAKKKRAPRRTKRSNGEGKPAGQPLILEPEIM
jgi:uncharacterized protein YgiM (DUF1202 family)